MAIRICLGASTLKLRDAGGHLWVYLNWALGLQAAGCRLVWLEEAGADLSGEQLREAVVDLRRRLAPFGLADSVAVSGAGRDSISREIAGPTLDDLAAETDLLLNVGGKIAPASVSRFRRSALVDIDPGLTQIWLSRSGQHIGRHDAYFSIGETVGTPDARFPDCGVAWCFSPTPVYLPAWPVVPASTSAPYTTVSSWWGWWEDFDGDVFNNEKRTAFLGFLELPRQSPVALEVALALWEHRDHEDVRLFESNGWRVKHAFDVAGTPEDYRAYLSRSRGEFSCAKPSCIRLENAWLSDRTLCYMAMGKPAIVQYTGPSRLLPDGAGLFRFRTVDEAAAALAAAEADYEYHARQARSFVEEHHDARTVVNNVLERML